MDIGERYEIEETSDDTFYVLTFKRDIGNNTYSFVAVQHRDAEHAAINVSRIVYEEVHKVAL